MAHPKVNRFYGTLSSTEELARETKTHLKPFFLEPEYSKDPKQFMSSV